MKTRIVAIIVVIILLFMIVPGCKVKPLEIEEFKEPTEEKAKEYSLDEITKDTSIAFAQKFEDIFSSDNFLLSLAGYKPRVEQVEEISGPVSISVITPENNSYLSGNIEVRVLVNSTKPIEKVDFYIDGNLRESVKSAPYSWSWNTSVETRTKHTLKAVATDGENVDEDSITTYVVVEGQIGFSASNYLSKSGNVKEIKYYDPAAGSFYDIVRVSSYESTSHVIYQFDPPNPYSYLNGLVDIDSQTLEGNEPIVSLFDWSSNSFKEELYDPYARVDIGAFTTGSNFAFQYFEPGGNRVKVKIEVPPDSSVMLKGLNLEYKYVYDKSAPSISSVFADTSLSAAGDSSGARFFYYVSENVFLDLYIKDSQGNLVDSISLPEAEGYKYVHWEVPRKYTVNQLKYYFVIQDSAGYKRSTMEYNLTPAVPSPNKYRELAGEFPIPQDFYEIGFSDVTTRVLINAEDIWPYVASFGNVRLAQVQPRDLYSPVYNVILMGPYDTTSTITFGFKIKGTESFFRTLELVIERGGIGENVIQQVEGRESQFSYYNFLTERYDYYIYDWLKARDAESVLDEEIYVDIMDLNKDVPFVYISPKEKKFIFRIDIPPRCIYSYGDFIVNFQNFLDEDYPVLTSFALGDEEPDDGRVEFRYSVDEDVYTEFTGDEVEQGIFTKIIVETVSGNHIETIIWGDQAGFIYHKWFVPPAYYNQQLRCKFVLVDSSGRETTTGYYYFDVPENP